MIGMHSSYEKKDSVVQRESVPISETVVDSSSQNAALQRKASLANVAAQRAPEPRPNHTGLPDNLKSGIENLSGFSMEDVRVHYNSSKPATVQALAYTQGTDIHVAPGQEHTLPHEAWHVAQQMAGRVSPTTNINGMPVNDNAGLEHEADVMGEMAMQRDVVQKCSCICRQNVGNGIYQRSGNVTGGRWENANFGYPDGKSVVVGKRMVVTLSLNPQNFGMGEEADKNKSQDDMMFNYRLVTGLNGNQLVKGHLLNANLGGKADDENLFPITDGANYDHLGYVENEVKQMVLDNRTVQYAVEVVPDCWNISCRNAVFNCYFQTVDSFGPEIKKSVSIHSHIPVRENWIEYFDKSKLSRGSVYQNGELLKNGKYRYVKGFYKRGINQELRKRMGHFWNWYDAEEQEMSEGE